MKRKKIVVTGGAGYIGSILVRQLLRSGYSVSVIDTLRFGGESIAELFNHQNFEFIKEDVKNIESYKHAIAKAYGVVHLAAIVGDPACATRFRIRSPPPALSFLDLPPGTAGGLSPHSAQRSR